MRLTHLTEHKDKRKNKEPMIKIRNKLFNYENIEEKHKILSLDDLDRRLTALEIIKKIVKIIDYSDHTIVDGNLVILQGGEIKNKEEYDLLKEVLL